MRYSQLLLFCLPFLFSCNSSADNTNTEEIATDSSTYADSTIGVSAEQAREAQLNYVISTTEETLDSIDAVYAFIRNSARSMKLSLEERQQVNMALQEINNARDLIILEAQEDMLEQLQQKTSGFKSIVSGMKVKSTKLADIAKTLAKLSDMIQKTTDAIVSAFSSGIIKPKTSS